MKNSLERIRENLKKDGIEKIEIHEVRAKQGRLAGVETRVYTIGSAEEFMRKRFPDKDIISIERHKELRFKGDIEIYFQYAYTPSLHLSDKYIYTPTRQVHYTCQHWLDWLDGWEWLRKIVEHNFELQKVPFIDVYTLKGEKFTLSFDEMLGGFMSGQHEYGRIRFPEFCRIIKSDKK